MLEKQGLDDECKSQCTEFCERTEDVESIGSMTNVKIRRKEGNECKCCCCVDAKLRDEVSTSKICTGHYIFSFAIVVILLFTVDGDLIELKLLVHSNQSSIASCPKAVVSLNAFHVTRSFQHRAGSMSSKP